MTESIININGPHFAKMLGLRLVSHSPDEVVMEMDVTPDHANGNGVLHGGAILGLADNTGGLAAVLTLGPGQATTTIESKTNFMRPVRIGDVARATARPLHKGSTTQIWQSTITRGDGKVAAIVTQTQMIMEWKDPAPLSEG
ncbi:MAG: PaaI family thioesterase [Paracoccus sp. (in: a-proteobacteria)]|nr:PaaI family thioesterase [Paracoccus sp. (in: a-proteobacteria)]